jgi:NAD(P)-dependent dehydrogenase (short-subunit alcohol dehydrogenase family)
MALEDAMDKAKSGKVILVTGANKGIGKEIVRQLARPDDVVLLGSRDMARGESAAKDLQATGGMIRPVLLDITRPEVVDAVAASVLKEFGRLDVLINNAGMNVEVAALDTTAAHLRGVFETNVYGVVTTIHAFLPLLQKSDSPRIVNVASTTASFARMTEPDSPFAAADNILAYASSKAAVNMLTVQYAMAFRRNQEFSHIKINSVTPGYVATELNGFSGPRTVEQGAQIVVRLARIPVDGPTGGFFNDDGIVSW